MAETNSSMVKSKPSCTSCGASLKKNTKFCGECGAGVSNADESVKAKPEKKSKKQELEEYEDNYVAEVKTKPDLTLGLSKVGKDATRRYIKGSYHTKITDTGKLSEIEKIADRLDSTEEVLMVCKQTKNPLKSGGSLFTPNTIIVTDQKILIRNPSALGLRQNLESFRYDTIVDLKLERGMFSASIDVNVPGLGYTRIDAIKKDEAEEILRIYQNAIQRGSGLKQQSHDIQQGGGSLADELAKLAKLKEQDIISAEEFQQMKNDLLSKM